MNYRNDKVDKLLLQAKRLIPECAAEYDFSKLSTEVLMEIIDGMDNNTISDKRLEEILKPIKIR